MSLQEAWESLERDESPPTGYIKRRRVYPESRMDIFVGLRSLGNAPILIWRISRETYLGIEDLPESQGFRVLREVLDGDAPGHGSLVLELDSPRFRDVFEVLSQDLAAVLGGQVSEARARDEFLARLRRWQAFLKQYGPDGLSEAAQQGLFGELWSLRQFVAPEAGIEVAAYAWTGPAAVMQDFQLKELAIEVKASAAKNHQRLHIASERQLDETHAGTLLLLHVSLDSRQEAGETLPELVASVRSLMAQAPRAREAFEEKLLDAGYLDVHEGLYRQTGYGIRESNFFHVRDGFPRIREVDLLDGVGDVRYTILASECKQYLLGEAEARTMIRGIERGRR